ncbi:hypothetical protein [Aestuariispira insulae]|uniref:Uncharacterized protein n=1 Tax=Aestuariispira insulae TaxID=1461337 RepID=A0A3D9HRQ2_9PROT|nr:hypothetical protein [Aestuariispira insulae]RED52177.1 hypothetical protein DFP90_102195 [Aestuariispira insulae]
MIEENHTKKKGLWQLMGTSTYWIQILFYGLLLMLITIVGDFVPDFDLDLLSWIDPYYDWVILAEVREHYPVEGPFPEQTLGPVERYAGVIRDIGYYQAFQIDDGLSYCGTSGIGTVVPALNGLEIAQDAAACHYDYSEPGGVFIRYRFTENSLLTYYLTDD